MKTVADFLREGEDNRVDIVEVLETLEAREQEVEELKAEVARYKELVLTLAMPEPEGGRA